MAEIREVKMKITETNDGQFVRTALQINASINSFDLLDKNGDFICRINVSEISDEEKCYSNGAYYDVDVCRLKKGISLLAWDNGCSSLNKKLEGSSMVAIIIPKEVE